MDELRSLCAVIVQSAALGAPLAKALADYSDQARRKRAMSLKNEWRNYGRPDSTADVVSPSFGADCGFGPAVVAIVRGGLMSAPAVPGRFAIALASVCVGCGAAPPTVQARSGEES